MPSNSAPTMAKSSKMHSKHHQNHHHTMSSTYTPQYCTYPQPTARNPTWPEKQADLILSLRDVSNPPAKTPDPDVRNLHPDSQIHVRWTDPDLVRALVRIFISTLLNTLSKFLFGLSEKATKVD